MSYLFDMILTWDVLEDVETCFQSLSLVTICLSAAETDK